jgi:hypothetical protein
MSLRDLQARIEIVNFLNAAQNVNHYYIDLPDFTSEYQIIKRSLARYTHKIERIPDTEIPTEVYDLRDHLGNLFDLSRKAVDQLNNLEIK